MESTNVKTAVVSHGRWYLANPVPHPLRARTVVAQRCSRRTPVALVSGFGTILCGNGQFRWAPPYRSQRLLSLGERRARAERLLRRRRRCEGEGV